MAYAKPIRRMGGEQGQMGYLWRMYVVWFKRDLRVQDHGALAAVPVGAPVIPLYVVEPE